MKKTIATLFLTTAMSLCFGQESTFNANAFAQPTSRLPVETKEANHLGTFYVKMGANESELPKNDEHLMPGLGAGYRAAFGHHGVDVSFEGNRKEIRNVEKEKVANYSHNSKVNYLFYATPASASSFYFGAGLGFGGMKETTVVAAQEAVKAEDGTETTPAVAAHNDVQEFVGIIPDAVLGYEFGRNSAVRTFVELNVSQPTISVLKEGEFFGPKVALNLGLGF